MGVLPQITANPALASCVLDTLLKCPPDPLVWGTPTSFQIRFRGSSPRSLPRSSEAEVGASLLLPQVTPLHYHCPIICFPDD